MPGPDDPRSSPAPPAVTLALGGDTILGRLVAEAIGRHGPAYPWGNARSLIASADLTLVNLECVVAAGGRPFQPPRVFTFRAPPVAVETLQAAGIDYVGLANNHTMDFGPEALAECLQLLDRAGIAHAGAGPDLDAAGRFALLAARGVRVAVIACADHYLEYAATRGRPGTKIIRILPRGGDFDWIRAQIGSARAAGADLVVFSVHWGPNMRERPTPDFVAFAHAVMDAGADLFHGHSAHVFQGIELYQEKPIFYDTGELVDDYAVDTRLRNDQGLLYRVRFEGRTLRGIELVPLLLSDMQVNLAVGSDNEEIAATLERRSAAFGTRFRRAGSRLECRL